MSSSTLFQTQAPAIYRLERTTQASTTTPQPRFKIRSADFVLLLPIIAVVLLLIGFGIVAVPLAVHDLPLLLG